MEVKPTRFGLKVAYCFVKLGLVYRPSHLALIVAEILFVFAFLSSRAQRRRSEHSRKERDSEERGMTALKTNKKIAAECSTIVPKKRLQLRCYLEK